MATVTPINSSIAPDPKGRLDIAASKIAARGIHHLLNQNGLGDLADGIVEFFQPHLQEAFGDLFGTKPIELPERLTTAVTNRLINGMNSRVAQAQETQQKK